MAVVIFILVIALVSCITHIIRLNQDIRNINSTLETIINNDTNMLLTTITFSKNVRYMSILVNRVLNNQRIILMRNKQSSGEFKQAITNISHDLRTPLTSIMGYIQMIQSDTVSPENRIKYIMIVEERTKYLSDLINSLFEYSRVFEMKNTTNMKRLNLCNVLRDTMSSYYQRFMDEKFSVTISIPDFPVYYMCDSHALERIFSNLIENVLKHGVDYFELIFEAKPMTIIFKNRVADMSKVDVLKMFDRFYTADLSRNAKSTGLGLAIAKEYVTKIGGKISAKTENDMVCLCIKMSDNIASTNSLAE